MDTVPVSLDTLQGLLGKPYQELQSALMIDKDGTKVPIEQSNIDKYVTDATRARLTEMKGSGTELATSGGKKLAFEEVEKFLKDNFGVEIKPGDGAYKKAITEAIESAKTKAQTSDEAVKGSQAYKDAIAKLEAEEKAHQTTKSSARQRIIDQAFQKATLKALSDKSLSLALPENETNRTAQVEAFTLYLKQKAALEMVDEDTVIPVSSQGKQLEDSTYNKITLDQFIISNAKLFFPTVKPGDGRQAPPAGHENGQPAPADNGAKFPRWKDNEEFTQFVDKAIMEKKDSTYLNEALAAFESQTK